MSRKPSEVNRKVQERRERNLCLGLMSPGGGAPHDYRPVMRVYGDWRDRIGFGRMASVFIQNNHPAAHERNNHVLVGGKGEPPAYNVQREAGINFPVAWNVAQNGYVVINRCSIWSVHRSNNYMRESKDLRFHVLFYVDEGNKSVEFGWTREDPRGTADFSVVIDRPTKKESGLWFSVRTLS